VKKRAKPRGSSPPTAPPEPLPRVVNRLLLVLSLFAFTVSGSLGALSWQALETRRELTARNATLDGQLASSRELASSFQKQAVTAGAQLEVTKTQLAASETRTTQLATDLAAARAAAAAREQAERTLRDEVAWLRRACADARATAIPAAQMGVDKSAIAELEAQLTTPNGAALPHRGPSHPVSTHRRSSARSPSVSAPKAPSSSSTTVPPVAPKSTNALPSAAARNSSPACASAMSARNFPSPKWNPIPCAASCTKAIWPY